MAAGAEPVPRHIAVTAVAAAVTKRRRHTPLPWHEAVVAHVDVPRRLVLQAVLQRVVVRSVALARKQVAGASKTFFGRKSLDTPTRDGHKADISKGGGAKKIKEVVDLTPKHDRTKFLKSRDDLVALVVAEKTFVMAKKVLLFKS